MKNILLLIFGLTLNTFAFGSQKDYSKIKTINNTMDIDSTKLLRHVVMFKFKDSATADQIQTVIDAFAGLKNEITAIKHFEWGLNNSPENLNQGLTHCFTLTFESEEDRNAYLPHPAHKAFGKVLGPILDKVVVIDYWTN